MSVKHNVLVVGLGAVGAIYSYVLKRGGNTQVTCVARSNYEATLADGIHIRSRVYGDIPGWKPDRLCRTVKDAADTSYSYVLLTTKSLPDIVPTAAILEPLLSRDYVAKGPLPVFVFVQNGLEVERDVYDAIKGLNVGEPKIISTALWIGTNLLPGNVISHVMASQERLSAGIYRPSFSPDVKNSPEEALILQEFAALFKGTDNKVTVLDEVQRVKFKKNFWNAGLGSSSALTRYPLPAFFREETVEKIVVPQLRAIMQEILSIGRAMGFDENALPSSVVEETIESTARIHKKPDSTHRASILIDLENGRPMELEVVVGVLVRKAKELRVEIPRLELIYSYLYLIQQQILAGKK
ncbi:hypothetical protein M422DRAFT_69495 [Sphaerobolus stellatus SS14]|uniref:2-dehydropantoate 2-reductase n=1 Tax=Sphaerobolus stellatus (strain SS14) TaxID=990650 RepID=A0A0C9UQR6_SPHS4|nr:hypothetical protein M422DRAFT_69495 [Sphaerobolus stellatus SS14]